MKKTLTLQPLAWWQVQMRVTSFHSWIHLSKVSPSGSWERGCPWTVTKTWLKTYKVKSKAKKIVSETSEHKKFPSRFFLSNSVGFPKGLIWRQKETQTIYSGLPSLLYRVFFFTLLPESIREGLVRWRHNQIFCHR